MKTTYKIMAFAAALVAFAGCAREVATTDNTVVTEKGKVSILATTNATKVTLDGTALNWEKGDKILVNDGSKDHTYTTSQEGNKVVFTGEDELTTGTNYAVFPSYASIKNGVATSALASNQDGALKEITDAEENDVLHMYASSTDNPCYELEFSPAVAVLKFQVSATTMPKYISFNADNIVGDYEINFAKGTVTPTSTNDDDFVKVTAEFAEDTDYYVAVLPGTYDDGIWIYYAFEGEEEQMYLSAKTDITLEAGKLYNVGTIDLNIWKLVESDTDVKNGEYMVAIWEPGEAAGTSTLKVLSLENLASNADQVGTDHKDGEGLAYYKQNAKNIYNTIVDGNYLDVTGNHKGTAFKGTEKKITLPEEATTAVATITMTTDNVTVANGSYSLVLEDYNIAITNDNVHTATATITGRPQAESVVSILTTMNGTEPAWTVQTVVDYFASSDLARRHLYNMLEDMGYSKTDKLTDLYKDEYATDAFKDFYLANVVFDTSKDGFTVRSKTWEQMDQFVQVFIPQIQGYLEKTTEQLEATDYAKLAAYISQYLGKTVTADQIKAAFEDTTVDGTANWDALIAEYKTKINNWISKAETYVGKASDQSSDRYTQVQLWYKVGSGE